MKILGNKILEKYPISTLKLNRCIQNNKFYFIFLIQMIPFYKFIKSKKYLLS